MAEYLAPGVYVEEVERGAAPLAGVSTSTAGFLGPTERGPADPRLLTSFSDFTRLYGGYLDNSDLPAAVAGFFTNGGNRCFLGRVTGADETAVGELSVASTDDSAAGIKVKAIGPGSWGEHVALIVSDASMQRDNANEELFKLTVRYWRDREDRDAAERGYAATDDEEDDVPDPDVEEVYNDLSPHKRANNFVKNQVNGTSALIKVMGGEAERPENSVKNDGESIDPEWLSGNFDNDEFLEVDDYKGEVDETDSEDHDHTGFEGFKQIPEISIVCIPDETLNDQLTVELITHCNTMGDRFAILQADKSATDITNLRPPDDTDMAAFYYPWLKARNPETGLIEEIPPGGHVAGIYARSDAERGVHKAPANEVVRGISDIQRPVTKDDQEILNPRGVNCIRSFRGRGIRVWGARTASSNPEWKYVNVRRLFLFLRESIEEGTQWVIFEPNNEELWARVRQTIKNFLTDVWEDGALMGSTQDEAFFVKCDRTTMTQSDIENGRLICEIGVAPTRPAEFVIFRISQWTSDAA